ARSAGDDAPRSSQVCPSRRRVQGRRHRGEHSPAVLGRQRAAVGAGVLLTRVTAAQDASRRHGVARRDNGLDDGRGRLRAPPRLCYGSRDGEGSAAGSSRVVPTAGGSIRESTPSTGRTKRSEGSSSERSSVTRKRRKQPSSTVTASTSKSGVRHRVPTFRAVL